MMLIADQELDQARREVDQLDASSALQHGAISRLSQDSLLLKAVFTLGLGSALTDFGSSLLVLQELRESKVEADRLRRANEASEERLASLSSSAKCSRWQRLVQILRTVKASHRCSQLEWVHTKFVL